MPGIRGEVGMNTEPPTYDEKTRRYVSLLIVIGVLGYVYIVTFYGSKLSTDLESIVLNGMLMFVTGVLGYWIGSSSGSSAKTKILAAKGSAE